MSTPSWADRMTQRLLYFPLNVRLFVGALATAIPFYFAAYLSHSITETAKIGGNLAVGVHAVTFIVLLTAVVFVARSVATAYGELKNKEQSRIAVRLHGYSQLDRLVSCNIQSVNASSPDSGNFVETLVASRQHIQEIVQAAYAAFESAYGQAARTEDRIDFEVTFMTKSYKDRHITIPACANRDGRAPRSMVLRRDKVDIFENTVTAAVYREARPIMHIVEDTADPRANYHELYPEQNKRIRSSVVFPVLSDTNELLGTLVVHCDKKGFFQREDEKYWTDILEVFAKRLALTKTKLDKLDKLAKAESAGSIQIPVELVPDLF